MRRRLLPWILFVAAGIALGLTVSTKPWNLYRQQRALADESLREMRAAEAAQADLVRRKALLESRSGREEQARELGFRRPGEVPADDLGNANAE